MFLFIYQTFSLFKVWHGVAGQGTGNGWVGTHGGLRVRGEGAAAHHALVVHHVGVLRRRQAAAATEQTWCSRIILAPSISSGGEERRIVFK